jgi:hypothetical protein
LYLSGSLTASLQQGYVWVGNGNNKTILVATSSFFTTGSGPTDITSLNAFTASQLNINAGYNQYTSSTNIRLNNLESTSASVNISISNLNASSASQQLQINSLIAATASYVTSAITASSLVTASFSGNTLTFTKGDASTFGVVIPDVSGSGTTNTGSLLVTASAFINTITFTKGDGTTFPVTVTTGSLNYVTGSFGAFYDTTTQSGSAGVAYSMKLNNTDISDGVIISGSGGIKVLAAGTYDLQFSAQVLAATGADTVWIWLKKNGTNVPDTSTKLVLRNNEADVAAWNFVVSANANDVFELAWQSSGGHTLLFAEAAASNYTAIPSVIATMNRVDVGGGTNLVSTSSFNAYTASNDQKVNSLINATASYATSAITASSLITASVNLNTITFTKGDATTFAITVNTGSGGGATIDTGSFATTGSNTFTGDQTLIDNAGNFFTITDTSGSMMLVGKSYTSASAHLSSSVPSPSGSFVNLIFKTNNNTSDTIISGSNNIFVNPAAPTAGFKRYVGTNGNIILNASNVPQISGSMVFSPTMNNNTLAGNATTITMRGPVSSSAWAINGNNVAGTINVGGSAANNAEAIRAGLTLNTNYVSGVLTIIANRSTLTQALVVQGNNLTSATLTAASSSIQYVNNIGGITITNSVSGSANYVTNGSNAVYAINNIWAGIANTITTTGSSDPGDVSAASYLRQMEWNSIFGNSNGINLPYASTGSNSLNATTIAGFSLSVTGSNPSSFATGITSKGGSAFFGRYNALDGNRAQSHQTIFAVGTGTATGARKTGFLIDSGSNTFVEGTFNVSGSSTFTGSVNVTGSLFVNGISAVVPVGTVSSSAQIVAYGIFATTGSNSFNGNQRITGSLTMSGSIITVDRSGNDGNVYMGLNALGMGNAGAQPLAVGNSISVAIGIGAMRFASGSNQNVAIGNNALLITSGSKNFAMGSEAMSANTLGSTNVAIGTSALQNNTTGDSSTAIGDSAAQFASGSQNTFIGQYSGYNVTGSNNVIIGSYRGVAGEKIDNNIILSDGQQNIKAQYSGSAWSFQDNIKLNKGTNKTTDIVSVNGSATVNNSLVTAASIILVTTQNSGTGPVYPAVVLNKGTGTFDIAHNFGSALDVAYMIINPT